MSGPLRVVDTPRVIAVGFIHVYRWTLAPLLGPACRFEPSCSRYAEQAIQRHGLMRGLRLALRRISRCHPLGESGFDPVP